MTVMKRVLAIGVLALAGADPASAAEKDPCEAFCIGTWASCMATAMILRDGDMIADCDAWLDGCLYGCTISPANK